MLPKISIGRTTLPLIAFVLLSAAPIFSQEAATKVMKQSQQQSLYERLGGVYAIATVVDAFIEKLLVNDVLNANPAIAEARDRVPKAGLKHRVTEMVCQATGGPEKYNGRSMKESHAHLNITEEQWDAMVADLIKTLNEFKVPEKEQKELLEIMGSTKADIVMVKAKKS